jgi:hypothetical protein
MFKKNPILLSLPALAVWLSGCMAVQLPPARLTDPGWKTQQGQAVWRSGKDAPEIAGDLLLASHPDGRAVILFTKTPLPFVVAQTASNAWQIEFVPVNKKYSGHGNPPSRLIWFHLQASVAGTPAPKPWLWRREDNGNWRLENSKTGESLEGYLNP